MLPLLSLFILSLGQTIKYIYLFIIGPKYRTMVSFHVGPIGVALWLIGTIVNFYCYGSIVTSMFTCGKGMGRWSRWACQKNGCIEKAGRCPMVVGDRGRRDEEGMHKWICGVCLQWLEVDSGQIEVLNSKLEEARTAVYHLHGNFFPCSRNDRATRKIVVTQ